MDYQTAMSAVVKSNGMLYAWRPSAPSVSKHVIAPAGHGLQKRDGSGVYVPAQDDVQAQDWQVATHSSYVTSMYLG